MRLLVKVLPLAQGPANSLYSDVVLAQKPVLFSLPVKPEWTFGRLWPLIEERYKKNYLSPAQAANFVIKKLQDSYEGDLDVDDTIGAIFEGVTNQQELMVQVIQASLNREMSIPLTSNLRPLTAHKRQLETYAMQGNKRRRTEELESDIDPNRPVRSRERDSGIVQDGDGHEEDDVVTSGTRSRSLAGTEPQVVVVEDSQREPSMSAYLDGRTSKRESPRPQGDGMRHLSERSAPTRESPELGDTDDPEVTDGPFLKPTLPASMLRLMKASTADSPQVQRAQSSRRDASVDRYGLKAQKTLELEVPASPELELQEFPEQASPTHIPSEVRAPTSIHVSGASTHERVQRPTHSSSAAQQHSPVPRPDVYEDIDADNDQHKERQNRSAGRIRLARSSTSSSRDRHSSLQLQMELERHAKPEVPSAKLVPSSPAEASVDGYQTRETGTQSPHRDSSPMTSKKLLNKLRGRRVSKGEGGDLSSQSPSKPVVSESSQGARISSPMNTLDVTPDSTAHAYPEGTLDDRQRLSINDGRAIHEHRGSSQSKAPSSRSPSVQTTVEGAGARSQQGGQKWSPQEDKTLLDGRAKEPKLTWVQFAEKYFPKRTDTAVRKRYTKLQSKQAGREAGRKRYEACTGRQIKANEHRKTMQRLVASAATRESQEKEQEAEKRRQQRLYEKSKTSVENGGSSFDYMKEALPKIQISSSGTTRKPSLPLESSQENRSSQGTIDSSSDKSGTKPVESPVPHSTPPHEDEPTGVSFSLKNEQSVVVTDSEDDAAETPNSSPPRPAEPPVDPRGSQFRQGTARITSASFSQAHPPSSDVVTATQGAVPVTTPVQRFSMVTPGRKATTTRPASAAPMSTPARRVGTNSPEPISATPATAPSRQRQYPSLSELIAAQPRSVAPQNPATTPASSAPAKQASTVITVSDDSSSSSDEDTSTGSSSEEEQRKSRNRFSGLVKMRDRRTAEQQSRGIAPASRA